MYYRAVKIDPTKNLAIMERTLQTLVRDGRFVEATDDHFHLNLRDEGSHTFDRFLEREKEDLHNRGDVLFESLIPLLGDEAFHPFHLPQDRWVHRKARWQFHDRDFAVLASSQGTVPMDAAKDQEIRILVRIPWGAATPLPGTLTILPSALPPSDEWVELAALARAQQRHWPDKVASRLRTRLEERLQLFRAQLRNCYQEATFVSPQGQTGSAPQLGQSPRFDDWLEQIALVALRRTYPSFRTLRTGTRPAAAGVDSRVGQILGHQRPGR